MKRSEKPFVIEDLKKRIEDAKSFIALDYQGLTVKEIESLRQSIREAGGNFLVVKNTLLKLALEGTTKGTEHRTKAEELLSGPTAVVFAEEDEIAPLQKLGKFISGRDLPKLKFGLFGSDIYGADKLLALSRLPGKNVLFSRLVGAIAGPQYGLVGALSGNLQKLIYILGERQKGLSH